MTKVKICGLQNKSSVTAAVAAGADYLGFVFAESPRRILPEKVREITQNLPKHVKKVGVFVSPTLAEVEETITAAQLDMIQIHGDVLKETASVPMILAQSAKKNRDFQLKAPYQFLLLDAPPKKLMGGNGEVFDWHSFAPEKLPRPLWIAGGLTTENVAAAIQYFQPEAVDVSSGVETNGEKDLKKITAFCTAAKAN